MTDVGRALVITSVVLVLGFLVLRISSLDTLVVFGAVIASAVSLALIADFFLMPSLVLTFEPFGPEFSPRSEAPPRPVDRSLRADGHLAGSRLAG